MSDRIKVSVAQAKNTLPSLIRAAEAGAHVVITRNGKPVAELGAMKKPPPFVFGDLAGLEVSDDLSIPEDIIDLMEGKNWHY